jgi:hypothetical protein
METDTELSASDRALARWLRNRLETRAPADLLARISDAELIEQYRAKSQDKLEAIRDGVTGKVSLSKW